MEIANTVTRESIESAAEWYVLFQSAPPSEQNIEDWKEWLRKKPEHAEAWRTILELQSDFKSVPSNLVNTSLTVAEQSRRRFLKLFITTASVGTIAWSLDLRYALLPLSSDYSTSIGEIRKLSINGIGEMFLNTDTALDIKSTTKETTISLYKGEILLAPEPSAEINKITIVTKHANIEPNATSQTMIRRYSDRTSVSTLKGTASVINMRSHLNIKLKEHHRVNVFSREIGSLESFTNDSSSWITGKLLVREKSLSSVLSQISRYQHGIIRWDEGAGNLIVSGNFILKNPNEILNNLAHSLPIKITHISPYFTFISYKS
ncbi:DUF4880 domain-containing protein [Pseudomonas aeruginosa]|uniref:DUF4880 domain-containing protein n=1 Tax=Pseudomonas aeruginosa TaxID=287 RepID=UPI0034D2C525